MAKHGGRDTVGSIHEALRARIGDERHDVWFGGSTRLAVDRDPDGGFIVTLVAGSSLTHGLIQRTFRGELLAAVREALGAADVRIEVVAENGTDTPDHGAARPAEVPEAALRTPGAAVPPAGDPVPPRATGLVRRSAAPSRREETEAVGPEIRAGRVPSSLEGFVVGAGNRMAQAAVSMIAEQPGAISPLVLHGPSGVGKTHLLEGACRRFRERHPRASTVLLSAEQFTTAFLEALHGRRGLPGFRRSLRSADLLVIDDIHFFAGKKATVSEFVHTLEALHRSGRQVVLSTDRDVEALEDLGDDVQARLRGGMSVRVLPPDEETRRGIVEALAARRGLTLPEDVVRYVAGRMTRNTRELAGAVNRLEAMSHMLGIPVEMPMARECLADLVRSSTRGVRLADVERAVCSVFGVDPVSLHSACRTRRVNHPRILAMFLARKHTDAALTEIGRHFGRRSHSTVIAAQRTVDAWIARRSTVRLADAEWDVAEAVRRVEEIIRAG